MQTILTGRGIRRCRSAKGCGGWEADPGDGTLDQTMCGVGDAGEVLIDLAEWQTLKQDGKKRIAAGILRKAGSRRCREFLPR